MSKPEDDEALRHETETEGLDRNWISLLQELRVVQTGVQLLTGFLLMLPFQDRFSTLSDVMKQVYLVTVLCSIASTVLLIAPVATHRLLFRRHQLEKLVTAAHRYALGGLTLLGLTLTGVVTLMFDVVVGGAAATGAAAGVAVMFSLVWLVLPLRSRPN